MSYPSTIGSFTNPTPNNKLSSPSHSSIETMQNTALTEIQTFVGTESSIAGTLIYDIRSSSSNGGGHVQTANKGGTGQTSYTKGDLLIGQSQSVLAKLAVGGDGLAILADSTQQVGLRYGAISLSSPMMVATAGGAQASVMTMFYDANLSSTSANEGSVLSVSPITGSITSLYLRTTTAQPSSGSQIITFRRNRISQSVVAVIPANATAFTTYSSDVGSVFGIVAGDTLGFQIQNNSTTTSAGFNVSYRVVGQ